MSKVWFASDPHWSHNNICKYRPFETPEEHDNTVFENIMAPLKKRDTLWILGDICFNKESLWRIVEIAKNVQTLRLIMGNHCLERGLHVRDYIDCGDNIRVDGITSYKNFWITHAPIHPSELRNRNGNIYGHAHNEKIDDNRYRCVSMEQIDYKPISFEELREEYKRGEW